MYSIRFVFRMVIMSEEQITCTECGCLSWVGDMDSDGECGDCQQAAIMQKEDEVAFFD